jgi:signal transduction histidine kinase
VAHEIGNKLNPMAFVVHNLKKRIEKGKEPDAEQIEVLTRSIDDCSRIIEKLRALARPEQQTPNQPVDLNEVVNDATLLLGAQTKSRGVNLSTDLASALPAVDGAHSDLVQVLINLVLNAREAVLAGDADEKQVTIKTYVDSEGRAVLEIEDNGIGMDSEVISRVYEPFFTTKGMNTGGGEGGSGLGLYICYGILSRHGVEPLVRSKEGEGTSFVLAFPLSVEERHESTV